MSCRTYLKQNNHLASQEAMAHEEQAEAGEMQLHTTFMFVITASCSLVLIFYFMSGERVCGGGRSEFLHVREGPFVNECVYLFFVCFY
jgi:hypothetical protein